MKNILIMGIGRAGKTTLSKMIKDTKEYGYILESGQLHPKLLKKW